MGTMLLAVGFDWRTHIHPLLNLTHPAIVRDIHAQYVAAGAWLLTTNTFGVSYHGARGDVAKQDVAAIARGAVRLAREAAAHVGAQVKVGGSIGPLGAPLVRLGEAQARAWFALQAAALNEARADLLMLETFIALPEAQIALAAARAASQLPVWVLFSVNEEGILNDGTPIEAAAQTMLSLGAAAVGVNCSLGPPSVLRAVQRMAARRAPGAALVAKPSAGLPDAHGAYPFSAEDFAHCARELHAAGAAVIGGCCGSTPAHIQAMRQALNLSKD